MFGEPPGIDPLAQWRTGVQIRPAASGAGRHTIHSYFNTCPESPDGKWLLFFSSTAADGQRGEIRIRNRQTDEEKVLVQKVSTEDAHRAACQQWVSGGRRVVFHDERQGEWLVAVVDLDSGRERILARGRLLGWGQPQADVVPIYGPHWNPGAHRDLELLNVATGEIRTGLTVEAVKAAYPEWMKKNFSDKPASIFFPILSPDLKRVFFKMAVAGNGEPRSSAASTRQGLVCYSLAEQRFLYQSDKWGHPAWHPDGQHIVEAGLLIYDSSTGKSQRTPGIPWFGGGHPSASPNGKLWLTDTWMDKLGGSAKDFGVVVADAQGTNHILLTQFNNSQGARSWRKSHPHPIFSADGNRIYFNVNSNQWTQLFVAERNGTPK
jgi:Tol biopolymer transport system component